MSSKGSASDSEILEKDHDKITTTSIVSYEHIISEKDKGTLLSRLLNEGEVVHTEEIPPQVKFMYEKMESLSEERSLEILDEALIEFADDPNFEPDAFERIQELAKGRENYLEPENYDFQLRMEAAIIYYYSPYREVPSMVNPYDDPDAPCETIRMYAMCIF